MAGNAKEGAGVMGWIVQFKQTPEGVLKWKGVREVVLIREGANFLRLVYLPCGRANCSKCPHGPYWYFGYTHRRKVRQVYIGKSLMNDAACDSGGAGKEPGRGASGAGVNEEPGGVRARGEGFCGVHKALAGAQPRFKEKNCVGLGA